MDLKTAKDTIEAILARGCGPYRDDEGAQPNKIELIKALRKAYSDGMVAARQEGIESYDAGYSDGKRFAYADAAEKGGDGDAWDKGYEKGTADTKANWDAVFEERAEQYMVKQLRTYRRLRDFLSDEGLE